ERRAQLLQNLTDKLPRLAQGTVRGNPPLRLDVRKHPPLIEKPSAHRKSSCRISRKSESPPLRCGEVFQQTVSIDGTTKQRVERWHSDSPGRSLSTLPRQGGDGLLPR